MISGRDLETMALGGTEQHPISAVPDLGGNTVVREILGDGSVERGQDLRCHIGVALRECRRHAEDVFHPSGKRQCRCLVLRGESTAESHRPGPKRVMSALRWRPSAGDRRRVCGRVAKLHRVGSTEPPSADRFLDYCRGHVGRPNRFCRHWRVVGIRWQGHGRSVAYNSRGEWSRHDTRDNHHHVVIAIDWSVLSLVRGREMPLSIREQAFEAQFLAGAN